MRVPHPLLLCLLLTCAPLVAQSTVTTNNVAIAGFTKHTVQNAAGELFTLSVGEDANGDRPLLLHTSSDQGVTWNQVPFTFNDPSSGLGAGSLANNSCSLAIDDAGFLHAVWAAYSASGNAQWYRNYDPVSGASSSIVSISAVTGASSSNRSLGNQITVDQNNVVWIVAHGASNWREALVRSDNPYAVGESFTNLGFISVSASAQAADICIDVNGLVHLAYYRNLAPGQFFHRIYDPINGWQASTNIGNGATAPHDYRGKIVADYLGNVHALIAVDSGTPATTWSFEYRIWDAINGWSAPVVVFTATQAEYTGVANYQIFDIACDQATGKAYAVYRDLAAGGMLRVAEKGLTDATFTVLGDITVASLGLNEFYLPSIRGSLYPSFNNLNGALDITYQYRMTNGVPPYSMLYSRVPVGGPSGPTFTLNGAPVAGANVTCDMSSAADAGRPYAAAFSFSNTPGIALPDSRVVPLNIDALFLLSTMANPFFSNTTGVLDGAGNGSVGVAIPNVGGIAGITFYAGAVAIDGGAPSGISTVFPSLQITLQ